MAAEKKSRTSELLRKAVSEKLNEKHIDSLALAAQLYRPLGYRSLAGAHGIIDYIKRGWINGTISLSPTDEQKQLWRTSVVLYALGFSGRHPLIKELRETDPLFKYPPELTPELSDKIESLQREIEQRTVRINEKNGARAQKQEMLDEIKLIQPPDYDRVIDYLKEITSNYGPHQNS